MNPTSPQSSPPRRWWPRFGIRSLFGLIAVAALIAWWLRAEVLHEQRREELIAEFQVQHAASFMFDPVQVGWRRRFGAWLRGKPPAPAINMTVVNHISDARRFREFVGLFPESRYWVSLLADQATPDFLDALPPKEESILTLAIIGVVKGDDESLRTLARARSLQGISIEVPKVDDALLRRLTHHGVDLAAVHDRSDTWEGSVWNDVSNDGLVIAASFPKLGIVTAGRGADDLGLAAFQGHPKLRAIQLIGPGYTDASARTLVSLPWLDSLTLRDTRLTDAGLAKAIEGRALQQLTLDRAEVGPKTIAAIAGLKSLVQVNLKNMEITPALAAAIAIHPVQYLTLEGLYDDAAIRGFAPTAPSIKGLTLNAPDVTDAGLAWLSKAASLHSLQIGDSSLTAPTLRLPPAGMIGVLSLGGPNIDATAIATTRSMPKLESVQLLGISIDDTALAVLKHPISRVDLFGTRATTDGLKGLATAGQVVSVTVFHAEGSSPPFSSEELAEIKTATAGQVEASCQTVPTPYFNRVMPRYAR